MFWGSAGQRGSVGLLRCWSLTVSPKTLTPTRCPLHTPRSLSFSAPLKSPAHEEVKQPLRRWDLAVSPFTTVRAQIGCNISIHPLDPHTYPEADRAFITVHGLDKEQEVSLDRLKVHYDDRSKELLISAETVDSDVSIEMSAPIKSNLFITTQGKGSVQVKNMECDICKVRTEKGNCLLHSVKACLSYKDKAKPHTPLLKQLSPDLHLSKHLLTAHQVEVQSHEGHVTGVGTINGNVVISTGGDSAVDVKKLQGTKMNVSTEHGPLKVKAIYAESTCISSRSGRVNLGHVHGETTVKNVCGDTVIDGSNSFLKVSSDSGGIDVYVGDGGSAELHSQQGAVSVRVPSSLRAGVRLCGTSVDISPEVVLHGVENNTSEGHTTVTGYMNVESPANQWVKAQADRGSIRLTVQSWFESRRLGS
ncbi:protein FAM185A isoform X1 [Pelmatolapia mariae]|uniref:protein FAM185A isoform X1 n=1 Tax=Pelmatolapia mariae TaxID=158779 RepID=UPI002FE59FF0